MADAPPPSLSPAPLWPAGRARGPALGCLALVIAGSIASSAPAQDAGVTLAQEGRCAAALPLLETTAERAGPEAVSTDRAILLGRCQMRLGNYAEAAAHLEAALAARPDDADLLVDLAIARFSMDDREAARTALAAARKADSARAELPLYEGLIALGGEDQTGAAGLFARARELAGDEVEPVASYYEGIAHTRGGDPSSARTAFERVIAEWPGTEWSEAAEKGLERLELREKKSRWATVMLGAEYDENAILRGRGVRRPDDIAGDADERIRWTLHAGQEVVRNERWVLATAVTYQGNEHDTLADFDVHYPSVSVWLDHSIDATWTARLLTSASYAWVGDTPFLSSQAATASLLRHGDAGATRLQVEVYRDNFLFSNHGVPDIDPSDGSCPVVTSPCSPFGIDEATARNRDGIGWRARLQHSRAFLDDGLEATVRIGWHAFSARGTEYSFDGPEIRASVQARVPARLGVLPLGFLSDWTLGVSGAFFHRSFRHPTTFPDPIDRLTVTHLQNGVGYSLRGTDRTENEVRTEVSMERALGERVRLQLRWRYQSNRSSAAVFDFDRHRFGAAVTFGFGK